jgi:hypothetical protein
MVASGEQNQIIEVFNGWLPSSSPRSISSGDGGLPDDDGIKHEDSESKEGWMFLPRLVILLF